jgi:putative transcriptional regulator
MPKTKKALRSRDAKRNIGIELLQAVREMKAGRRGRTHKVKVPPYEGLPHE